MTAALAWSALGLNWLEMMSASGQVIARRSRRKNTPAQLFGMGDVERMGAGDGERDGALPVPCGAQREAAQGPLARAPG